MAARNGVNGVNGHKSSPIVSVNEFVKHEFDYLVLGGGTAGLVVAARLAEDSDVTVGVIEAGKNMTEDMLVNTPAMFMQMLGNPDYDWKYMSTPQVAQNQAKSHHIARGKMLGGSSAINYLLYVRGSDADYDDWAKIVGDEGWNSRNMKQYMRKHQKLEPIGGAIKDRSSMPFVGENHGTSGPIHTSFNEWKMDIEDDVVAAADKVLGYDQKPVDPWSGDHNGFYHTLAAINRTGPNKGKRSFAFNYIDHQPNIKILCEAHVSKIELDQDRATGATFIHEGHHHTVNVKREVIVCGGVVGSPQILELSGIGDPAILSQAGVECQIENRAIGENLQDHVVVNYAAQTPGIDTLDSLARPEVLNEAIQTYTNSQGGPIAAASTVQGFFPYKKLVTNQELDKTISSIRSIKNQSEFAHKQRETIINHLQDGKSANLQLVMIAASINPDGDVGDQTKLTIQNPDVNGITLGGCLQYPVSRGSTHIKSSDPLEHPIYDPGFLRHQSDIDVLGSCLNTLHQISQTEPLKSKFGKRITPRPELDLTNIEDCKQAVKEFYISEYHPVGTVAMGDALTSKLIVKGTKNIRVADSSVFPGHVSGNIMSSVYMVGEKAADLIKEDWNELK